MRDIENIIKKINDLTAPISKINRDWNAYAMKKINDLSPYHNSGVVAKYMEQTAIPYIPSISDFLNSRGSILNSITNKTFKSYLDEISNIANFFKFDNPLQQNLQEFFSQIDINAVLEDEEIIEAFENSETEFTDNEINKQAEFIYGLIPGSKELMESHKENNHSKSFGIIIRYLFELFLLYMTLIGAYNNEIYKINRDNVRIRQTPNKDNNKNIICKLNKNISVIKVDSENGWAKIRFEQEDGVQKEGWVYGNMISEAE